MSELTLTEQNEQNAAPLVDLDALGVELTGELPTPSEHVIEAESEKREEKAAQRASMEDSAGTAFDPDYHMTGADGSPVLTKLGRFRKKTGAARGAHSPKSAKRVSTLGTSPASTQKSRQTQRAAGRAAANALFTVGRAMGGEEWTPVKNDELGVDERAHLESAFADYFEAKELDDIPPGIALTVAIGGYMLPRFTAPKTQKRMAYAGNWFGQKWLKFKNWRARRGALSNIGDDGKRENDAGEKTSGTVQAERDKHSGT